MKLILSILLYPFLILLWVMLHLSVFFWLLAVFLLNRKMFNKELVIGEWKELRMLDKMLNPLFFYKK